MKRFVCIHGHFYQPPRENPWLESIELQDSAHPFHDWNERITAECYGPNTAARILQPNGKIRGILNNFSRISFNIGPTLLTWLEEKNPAIYERILEADRDSREIYSGHGCAIAQVHNHLIMPLANKRDKQTQIAWGVADFLRRFDRGPEGMWLAETAVDMETLELLVDAGIRYTILAPRQAAAVRHLDGDDWHDVSDGRVDPRRPYLCHLPSGRTITLFFYHGPIAQDLAFGGILDNGEHFANRLLDAFDDDAEEPQLVHVATDGETFGHHHRRGEMALSYCISHIESNQLAQFTNYAEYLDRFPPQWEVRIHENSSWSCVHGVERWRTACGCNSGMHPGWSQEWRAPLRESLDWLRDECVRTFESMGRKLLRDPWGARDRYSRVLLDRTPENIEAFLDEEVTAGLDDSDRRRALFLLEMQRNAMLMYTSCGWFFDEISGIETTQVLRYAARVVQIHARLTGQSLEEEFLGHLEHATGNIADTPNGRAVYEKFVKPATVDLMRVAIHFAVSSLFEDYAEATSIYCYDITSRQYERHEAGKTRMAVGRATITSRLTLDSQEFSFAVLHLGDQNLMGGIREFMGLREFTSLAAGFTEAFRRSDIPEMVRFIDTNFEVRNYSFWHLFSDEKRRIMDLIFAESAANIERFHRNLYREQYQLMVALDLMGMPVPRMMRNTLEVVLNLDLREALASTPFVVERYRDIMTDVKRWGIELDRTLLAYEGRFTLARLADLLRETPIDFEVIGHMRALLARYAELGVSLNLWYSQNTVYEIGLEQFSIRRYLADEGDPVSRRWVEEFKALSDALGVDVE